MNQNERKTVMRRMVLLIAVAALVMGLYALRLIFLQLVNGDEYKSQATNTTDYNFTVTAARGDIVDSTGKRIATTTTSYNVVLNKLQMGDEDLDSLLQRLVELFEKNGESWTDTLLISQPDAAGNYTFTARDDSSSDQRQLTTMKENLGLQQYATANDVMEMLVEKNNLQDLPLRWQRTLAGIHYEMELQAFSNMNNFVMAENVSDVTVATIKENSLSLPGVEIVQTSTRSYEQGDIVPAVLGRVGKITAEKWKVTDENGQTTYPLREKGYNMNDMIGVSGLEAVYEDELRGKDGVETITRSSDGVIVGTAMTTVPEPGHTVQLTIDSAFQQAVDKALAKNIEMINSTYNSGSSAKAAAGAVVVISTKDGSVLAASNYPSYDQNLFATQYSQYSSDPGLPLLNRALQGLYTPGSTFKLCTSVAALEEGIITPSTIIEDKGIYTYYVDPQPMCWIWRQAHTTHGRINVSQAIVDSCNYFYYEVGRLTGSKKLDEYATAFGLGQSTGIEIGDVSGVLASPEWAEAHDREWTDGQTITAAIGQSYNLFTPLQLANYVATLVSGGEHYEAHLLKNVKSYDNSRVIDVYGKGPLNDLNISDSTMAAVTKGMHDLTYDSLRSAFSRCVVEAGAKTGAAQVGTDIANGTFVAYAPYDDPEIAIAIVVEKGGSGSLLANAAVDIINAWFTRDGTGATAAGEDALMR